MISIQISDLYDENAEILIEVAALLDKIGKSKMTYTPVNYTPPDILQEVDDALGKLDTERMKLDLEAIQKNAEKIPEYFRSTSKKEWQDAIELEIKEVNDNVSRDKISEEMLVSGDLLPSVTEEETDETVDSENKLWDARIHSRTRSFDKEGKWKLKRGIDSKIVKRVEKETKTIIPAVPTPPKEDNTPQEEPLLNFGKLINLITQTTSSGKMTHKQIVDLVKTHGVEDIPLLGIGDNLQKVPVVYKQIQELTNV